MTKLFILFFSVFFLSLNGCADAESEEEFFSEYDCKDGVCNRGESASPECTDGEHLENDSCVSDTRSCVIKFGTGEQYWDSQPKAFGKCIVKTCNQGYKKDPSSESCISSAGGGNTGSETGGGSTGGSDSSGSTGSGSGGLNCSANQHEENGSCVSNIKACELSNGSGEQTWDVANSAYGECLVKSCVSNYSVDSKNNLCVETKIDCKAEITNAEIATKTFNTDTNSYGACALEKCSGEYVIARNSCSSKVQSCDVSSFANATEGKKAWNDSSSSFGPCQITKCAQDYSVDDTNNACQPNSKDCKAQIANAKAANLSFDTGSDTYVNCTLISCKSTYHIKGNACESDTKSCTITNGSGEQSWNGSSFGACTVKSCNQNYSVDDTNNDCKLTNIDCKAEITNAASATKAFNTSSDSYGACRLGSCASTYHANGNACESDTKSCTITNGSGEQSWNGSSFGACTVKTCNQNYSVDDTNNDCKLTNIDCKAEITNAASATKTFNTSSDTYGACTLGSCVSTYHVNGNACESDTKSCSVNNGSGEQSWDGAKFGECIIKSCDQGYYNYKVKNTCVLVTKDCKAEIANAASASQTFDATSGTYGACTLGSCNADYHKNGNACEADVQACTITNGSGQKIWDSQSSAFGNCVVTACDQNYSVGDTNNECKETVIDCKADIANSASATKTFDTSSDSYGSCTLGSCNSGYKAESNQCIEIDVGTLSPFYPVSPSPQSTCFNNSGSVTCPASGADFYGQDGNHQALNFSRFKDLGNGTVFDRVLKGYWQKCEAGLSGSDCFSGSAETKTWADAKSYCESLSLAGMDDWRLPDVYEGHGLINIEESSDPYSFRSVFPNTGYYDWSLTSYAADSSRAWYVSFYYADVNLSNVVNYSRVRCFRPGTESEKLSDKIQVEDQGDGILIEKTSRLRLTKCPLAYLGTSCNSGSINKMNWQDALASCENLSLGGRNWRLPSRYELSFFVDYKKSDPSVFDQTLLSTWYFDNVNDWKKNLFWTASTKKADPEYAWLVSMSKGHIYWFSNKKTDSTNVATLCVSDPKIDEATYARPIEVAAANESECKVCSNWSDDTTCTQPATCPARGEDGFGQEGSIPVGVPLRFKDFGDGRLLDLNTGRQWTKCTAGASGADCSGGTAEAKNWVDAVNYCDNLSLGGHDDWRLPHIKELALIWDFTMTTNPPINKSFFENFPDGKNVWSASEFKVSTYSGKIHTLYPSSDKPEAKSSSHFVLCTRAKAFSNDFIDNADGTISDKATNLMWQKCSAGQSGSDCSIGSASAKNWKDALKYCEDSNLAGYNDWQLPNPRQLQSIADYDKSSNSGPYIESSVFPNTFNAYYWSSSILADYPSRAWIFLFTDAGLDYTNIDGNGRVRCLRNAVY